MKNAIAHRMVFCTCPKNQTTIKHLMRTITGNLKNSTKFWTSTFDKVAPWNADQNSRRCSCVSCWTKAENWEVSQLEAISCRSTWKITLLSSCFLVEVSRVKSSVLPCHRRSRASSACSPEHDWTDWCTEADQTTRITFRESRVEDERRGIT